MEMYTYIDTQLSIAMEAMDTDVGYPCDEAMVQVYITQQAIRSAKAIAKKRECKCDEVIKAELENLPAETGTYEDIERIRQLIKPHL